MNKKSLFVSILALAFMLFACTEQPAPENPGDETGKEDVPGNEDKPGVGNSPELVPGEFPFYADFPIECGNLVVEGSEVGVSIEVKKVEDRNFVFELRPGAMVGSFKLDIYPIAQLYNNLLNDFNYGELEKASAVDVNERIRTYLFNEGGGGGFAFSIMDEEYQENPDSFLQIEFDWMNTIYSQTAGVVIPDCGFIIAVVAAVDEEITSANQQELTLCYVHTTSQPVIGDPQVEMEVKSNYTAFGVWHYLNADAAGYYYFGGLEEEIDEYIDTFGDDMFRDFVRTLMMAPVYKSDDPDAMYYGSPAASGSRNSTIAVAVDDNLTPQKGYARVDFTIDEVPEKQELAIAEVNIIEDRIAAAYFEFDVDMSKYCNNVYWTIYTEDEKAYLEASEEALLDEAESLAAEHGYGIHNVNFKWDAEAPEDERAIGSEFGKKEACWGEKCLPGATVYVGYTAVNGYGTVTPLAFSEAITFDTRNYDSPDNCKVKDLKLTVDNASRTGFDITVEYDPETVSMVYIQYQWEDNNTGLDEHSTWNEWIDMIFRSEHSSKIDLWWNVETGYDKYSIATGLTPGTTYQVFCCAEDFDGNISRMEIKDITTTQAVGGPDPTVTMTLAKSTAENADWRMTYTAVKDVENMRYAILVGSELADLNISGLNTSNAKNVNFEWMVKYKDRITYEQWANAVDAWIKGQAGKDALGQEVVWDDWKGEGIVLAACVAIGKDENDDPVYKVQHLFCENGVAKTLEEIFGIENN